MNRLRLVGLSHRTAAIEVREALAVGCDELPATLDAIVGERQEVEAVLLSTCNRVELYTFEDDDEGFRRLCGSRGVCADDFAGRTYERSGEAAVRHLFRVAASLDSMVPGETQIVGQVRRAYEVARAHGTANQRLHGLFQRAAAVSRQVMNDTQLTAGRYSVASVAASYADEVLGRLDDKRLLCVGTGKMTRLVLEHLHSRDPSHRPGAIVALGRDGDKAAKFAEAFGGRGGSLDELVSELSSADLVVCGTGSRHPVITVELLRRARENVTRPLFVIDLAVPRDVDHAAGTLAGVHLYDLDDLERAVDRSVTDRRGEISRAETIVEAHVARHVAWHQGRNVGPTIDRLYQRSHDLAGAEMRRLSQRLPRDLTEQQRQLVEQQAADMARRLVNKLLHGPVSALRQGHDAERFAAYRHAVEKLFSLDVDGDKKAVGSSRDD